MIELMVYCGLIGIIVVVAGQAYVDSSKFRVRSESMVKSSAEANSAATLLIEDLNQLGAKHYLATRSYGLNSFVYNDMSAGDHSSFILKATRDSIAFNKLTYDHEGRFEFAQQISWWKSGKHLYRSCLILDKRSDLSGTTVSDCGDENVAKTVLMAENVEKFELSPGIRMQDNESAGSGDIFPPGTSFGLRARNNGTYISPLKVETEAGVIKLSGFATNYGTQNNVASQVYLVEDPDDQTIVWTQCKGFNFTALQTYALQLQLQVPSTTTHVNYMRNFQPGVDHISVGFRTHSGNMIAGLNDFFIYPSQSNTDTEHYIEFSAPNDVNDVCLAFTFALYSPLVYRGYLNIANIALFKRDDAKYEFDAAVETPFQRKHVKAFKMNLDVTVRGEVTKIEKVIPTPNNGTED